MNGFRTRDITKEGPDPVRVELGVSSPSRDPHRLSLLNDRHRVGSPASDGGTGIRHRSELQTTLPERRRTQREVAAASPASLSRQAAWAPSGHPFNIVKEPVVPMWSVLRRETTQPREVNLQATQLPNQNTAKVR